MESVAALRTPMTEQHLRAMLQSLEKRALSVASAAQPPITFFPTSHGKFATCRVTLARRTCELHVQQMIARPRSGAAQDALNVWP